ncbi:class I SAM-dependent methyltransferase [Butyrivibrio sp. INlla16]|uniref:class I SAM-dependent methyltransferase n=1 Tax=Butyrivibrio sp. INlla16 TaxID=1520807 RepID=UPI000884972B|nr:class I SAM-dependent methyltransferase [Butyrivibrio sp. INlla16]SDB58552.1 Methyltransferase domain-containing protein [Butyrivibrio sp. INlla16]
MSEIKYIPFEEENENIKTAVTGYWTKRAGSFFTQRQHELTSPKAGKWLFEITEQIKKVTSAPDEEIKILDIGCGTGYFPVLLGKDGYEVTGIDLTEEMVIKAGELVKENEPYQKNIRIMQMDAEKLSFEDESFDVIVTRNLTWTLPHPIDAYKEWFRVLKKGGLLLNFDAEYAKGAHNLKTHENLAHKDISDELKDECHEIYHMLTISALERPAWDEEILKKIGFSAVEADRTFCDRIFSEKDEFYIPDKMFMISALK